MFNLFLTMLTIFMKSIRNLLNLLQKQLNSVLPKQLTSGDYHKMTQQTLAAQSEFLFRMAMQFGIKFPCLIILS